MLNWAIPVIVTLLVLVPVAFLLLRQGSNSMTSGFRLLQDNFESLQRNLLMHQKEFERGYEAKSAVLRQDLMQATQNLEGKFGGIDTKLDNRLKEMSTGVQSKLEQNLKEGFMHFQKVQETLIQTEKQLLNLSLVGQSINDLNNLLKMPHMRGNFGEALLEKLLCDLLPQDGYELQYRIVPNSTERVDAVIKYPNHVLPIDSKFPREQVLPLFETNDPERLEVARKDLCDVMKGLARQIKEKYIHPEHGTTEMALLFVPSETLYFEILRNPRLCEDLGKLRIFAVSPNTLSVTLHAIAMSRNYYDMAKGVEKTISEIKKAQQHFDNFESRFEEIGNTLGKAQTAFSTATTHLNRYGSAITRLTGMTPGVESLPKDSSGPLLNS